MHPSALVFPEGIPGTEVFLYNQPLACFTDLADAFDVRIAQTLGPWSETSASISTLLPLLHKCLLQVALSQQKILGILSFIFHE